MLQLNAKLHTNWNNQTNAAKQKYVGGLSNIQK